VPSKAGQHDGTQTRPAHLRSFYEKACDYVAMRTAYRCRAYPDEQQQAVLRRTFGCVRVVWNRTLAQRQARWQRERRGTSYAETDRALTAMKKDPGLAFLNQVSSVPLQQALRHQHTAFGGFFAGRARHPRFKSRRGRQTAHYTRSAFSLRGGVLQLAKTATPLRFVWSWPDIDVTALDPAMVIVCRESDGRWYVTFTVDAAGPEPLPETGRAVGVDLGVRDFAVTSGGERIPNPRHLERRARNLARYQRRLARCRQGSNNRAKAKAKVARAHCKVRNARQDFLHKTSTRLVRENDIIVVEDLNVAGMVRNRRLARAISDCGWGEFRRQLAYKCQRYGRELVVIDRWYPSSKTCSACGHLLAELSLSTRHWTCPSCRARHDRDINAAKNILAAGRAVARGSPGDACGGDVRHSGSPPGAVAREPGTPAREGRNPRSSASGRGVVKIRACSTTTTTSTATRYG
jgi:putative transposase